MQLLKGLSGKLLYFLRIIVMGSIALSQMALQPLPYPLIIKDTRALAPRADDTGVPTVTLGGLGNVPLGSDVNFTVTFDNNDTLTGYGPYIDVLLDTTGADGVPTGVPGTSLPLDGLGTDTISAKYLETAFVLNSTMWIISFDSAGKATHPLLRDTDGDYVVMDAPAGYGPGDTLVVLRLPFGSFVNTQPPAVVDMTVNMHPYADINTALKVSARGGFQFGTTALDDFCCGDDPGSTVSAWANGDVIPKLFTLSKVYSFDEAETTTGPNFRAFYPLQTTRYTVTATIAPGQTMNNVVLTDILPPNIQAVNLIASSPSGASCSSIPASPGGSLVCDWGSTVISGSASFTFDFYVTLNSADSGNPVVIDPTTGLSASSCNNVTLSANWSTPDTLRDLNETISEAPAGCEHTLADRSIAIQKAVALVTDNNAAGFSPGDVLEYTLDFQVSDYFSFQDLVISDIISDGQRFDISYVPELDVAEHGGSLTNQKFHNDAADHNYTVEQKFTGAVAALPVLTVGVVDLGKTNIEFRVSDEMADQGWDAKLLGGCVPDGGGSDVDCDPYNGGATYGKIKFRTVIQEDFSDAFSAPHDSSVDQGDKLTNTAEINGTVLNNITLEPYAATANDDTDVSVAIPYGEIGKVVYAISSVDGTVVKNPVQVQIKPGRPGDL